MALKVHSICPTDTSNDVCDVPSNLNLQLEVCLMVISFAQSPGHVQKIEASVLAAYDSNFTVHTTKSTMLIELLSEGSLV